jgi:phage tail sheath protein FI
MAELLSSKVAIIEEPPRIRGIPGLPTAVASAVGLAERGPIGEAVLVTSIEEFQRAFGGITTDLGLAALGFFQNGGSNLWVVRTVHYGNVDDASTGTAARAIGVISVGEQPAPAFRLEALYAGTYGNRLSIEIDAATNGQADAFDLTVVEGGITRETFANLSMATSHSRHFDRVINDAQRGSRFVKAVNLNLQNPATPTAQVVVLTGGSDGTSGLTDADFTGSETGRTGLHALGAAPDVSLVLIPGRATPAVHADMLEYCELSRGGAAFAVLDPPAGLSAAQMVTYVSQTAGIENYSEYGAIYWPRISIPNPNPAAFGTSATIIAPPAGAIAGVYARTDGAQPGGVYNAPAGVEVGRLNGVLGFETPECNDERKRDLVYPHRINPLRTEAGAPRYVDGSRTLKGNSNFPSIPERRGVSFIERSLRRGLDTARHRPNDERLRAEVNTTILAFLTAQMNVGAFASRDPKTAFFVEVEDDAQARFRGELHVRVGLATNKPAEFIVLHISADTRALEAELAAS